MPPTQCSGFGYDGGLLVNDLVCPERSTSQKRHIYHVVVRISKTLRTHLSYYVVSRIHGESFVAGGATDPGLNGSKLAAATGCIVAVVQYRLGAVCHLPFHLLVNMLNFRPVGLPRT